MSREQIEDNVNIDGSKPLKNKKHELFVKALFKHKFNQTEAYAEVYEVDLNDVKEYSNARHSASRLTTNVNITARVKYFLEEIGLNDNVVEKELLNAIYQDEDRNAKVKAIDIYFKYRKKYDDAIKVEVTNYKADFG